MNLGLGTVQFSAPYGIANMTGEVPSLVEVAKLLQFASENGIRTIDTAALYGQAEEILGRTMPQGHSFEVVTKAAKFQKASISAADVEKLEATFLESLRKLKLKSVYGLLFHHSDDLLSVDGDRLMNRALELKRQGLVSKVGVSIDRGPGQLDAILEKYAIDLVQVPLNILDQRLIQDGHLKLLKTKGIEIHVRSAFLQGLLLMEPDQIPRTTPQFERVKPHLAKLRSQIKTVGLSPIEAALSFIARLPEVDRVIVGVCSSLQLLEIVQAANSAAQRNFDFGPFSWDDELILNPARW